MSKFFKKLSLLFAYGLFLILTAFPFPAIAGSSNHGGDGVVLTFEKARYVAIEMVRTYKTIAATDSLSNQEFKDWFLANDDDLINDILCTHYSPTDDTLNHDALTDVTKCATVKLSLPILRMEHPNKEQAAALIIHESIHHRGVSDELFAYFGAARIGEFWEKQNAVRLGKLSVTKTPNQNNLPTYLLRPNLTMAGNLAFLSGGIEGYEPPKWAGGDVGPEILWRSGPLLYDPVKNSWLDVANLGKPLPRDSHSVVWTGNDLIIWGGRENRNDVITTVNSGFAYNLSKGIWRSITTKNAPEPRSSHSAAWTGKEMLIWGNSSSPGGLYDPVSDSWKPMAILGEPGSMSRFRTFWTGNTGSEPTSNKMLVIGNDGPFRKKVSLYSPVDDRWTILETRDVDLDSNYNGLSFEDAVWDGEQLVVFTSGSLSIMIHGQQSRWVFVFNANAGTWKRLPQSDLQPRSEKSYAYLSMGNSKVLAWPNGHDLGHILDISNNQWTIFDIQSLNLPQITNFGVVWTGESLITMGGRVIGRSEAKTREAMIEFP